MSHRRRNQGRGIPFCKGIHNHTKNPFYFYFFILSIISDKCSPSLSICFRRQCVTNNESPTNQSTMTSECLYIYFQHHVPTSSTSRLWYPWSDYLPAERRTCQRNLHATWTGLGFAPKVRLYNLADLVKNKMLKMYEDLLTVERKRFLI